MASPAACAQLYSSLVRVSTAPRRRRRPASTSFSRVRFPPAARTAPRSLSVSLSVLRPRAHRGREIAGDDAGFGFSPCDPAVEDPYDVAAAKGLSADADADDGLLLRVPFVEDPFELAATTGLGEGAHDEGDADLVLRVPFVEDPFELAATRGLGEGPHDEADADLVLRVLADRDPHELTATTHICVVARDDAGLVLHVPTVEEPHEVAATTTGLGDGADDDSIVYPTRLTRRDLDEYEATDFSRAAINERFRLESKEAKAAVTGAVVGVLRPLRELVHDVRSLESVFDTQEFQIGMPFGAIMTCMGMYQLWKLSPSTCIDVAMYYAFYKLSVIAADVRRRGFSPDWIIRIKFGIIFSMIAKTLGNKLVVPLDFSRLAIFTIYAFSVMWDVKGLKKYASKCFLPMVFYELSGGNLATEEMSESHVTEEMGETRVTEKISESHITKQMGESHVTEEIRESHVTEIIGEIHVTEEISEIHVTEKMSESHVTDEMSESHVTEEIGESHVTEQMSENYVTEEIGNNHVTEEMGESHATEKMGESHVETMV